MKLSKVDLKKKLHHAEYDRRLKVAQEELLFLERKIIEKKVPVIIMFEGWDAAGKGGAIKRLVTYLDPRGYKVHSIGAPTPEALAHHYLWRFWRRMPAHGEIAIFDRSWYGRVLVERVEGFAEPSAWQRAYKEINDFESKLTADGTIILKFFLHISKAEQLKRFQERAKNKLKNWKLTDDDWRNRKKWNDYSAAIDDMLTRTDKKHCRWHVIPANDKKYARIAVAETVVAALKKI
jgi:PPK2 family polyphosphate:nucleotide phosphotransferase